MPMKMIVLILMNMGVLMLTVVGMKMGMVINAAIGMKMSMSVGLFSESPVQTPDEIGQPESDEQPGGQISPPGFNAFKTRHGYSQGDSQKAKNDGTQDVAQAGEEGY